MEIKLFDTLGNYLSNQKMFKYYKKSNLIFLSDHIHLEQYKSHTPINNIRELYVSYQNLTSLPSIPTLEILDCYNNLLTSLPNMPLLKELWCDQLTSLPVMPLLVYLNGNVLYPRGLFE